AAAGRRGAPGNEANRGFLAAPFRLVFQELSRVFLRRAADFTDHHDRLGFRVCKKQLKYRNEFGSLHGIAANADRRGLAETLAAGLKNGLISEGTGARDDSHLSPREDIARPYGDLSFRRRPHAR